MQNSARQIRQEREVRRFPGFVWGVDGADGVDGVPSQPPKRSQRFGADLWKCLETTGKFPQSEMAAQRWVPGIEGPPEARAGAN